MKAILEFEGKHAQFEGTSEEVWKSITRFLVETDIKIELLSTLIIKIDLNELLNNFKGLIQIDRDVGPVQSVTVNIGELADIERVVFTLILRRVAFMMNYVPSDTMTVGEVQKESKAKNAGVMLSQLAAQKIIQNISEPGKKASYRVTDYGIQWFISKALPKLRREIP